MKDKNTIWLMCTECEYVFQTEKSPEKCPNCEKKCTFADVSCYIPECGGPDNVDTRLVAARAAETRRSNV